MFIFRHKACYLDSAIYAPTNKILVGLIELLDSLSVGTNTDRIYTQVPVIIKGKG